MSSVTPHAGSTPPRHLALFVSFSGTGGVERVTLNLLQGLSQEPDVRIDLLLVVARRGTPPVIPWPNIRVINLGVRHSQMAIPALIRYLRSEQPDVLMVAKDRAIRTAIVAHAIARVKTRLVGQLHMNMQGFLKSKSGWTRWTRLAPMRWLFPSLNKIIGVSEGVVEDTIEITGMPRQRVIAIRNPVITPELAVMAQEDPAHPWFKEAIPVVLGAGRLTPEKDFPTLIRAFARLREQRAARLMILGEGPLEASLRELTRTLGIEADVDFPGFTPNPFAYMQRAALFVMSSAWEGSGNVLVEALALGTPSVSTDCPFGPRETLADGRYGSLVPVGDDAALAMAMASTLADPLPAETLKEAVREFEMGFSARRYLDVLFEESTP
ncbi:MAG TPA: glycosyl transferase [Methylococcaceae bacterium]|nr:glycosyl transferase [Methylococcaceae bacterium]